MRYSEEFQFKDKFNNSKNKKDLNSTWIEFTKELNKKISFESTVLQVQTKLQNMKKAWSTYKGGRTETGNVKPDARPVGLSMMEEFWATKTGTNNTLIMDSVPTTSNGSVSTSNVISIETVSTPTKRGQHEDLEEGILYNGPTPSKKKTKIPHPLEYLGDRIKEGLQNVKEGLEILSKEFGKETKLQGVEVLAEKLKRVEVLEGTLQRLEESSAAQKELLENIWKSLQNK
ncbi:hypothetical protein HK103_000799 [Boothiomyces macroporosus]|uniref:Myb/SANT-like domain-containing protein n=1 Tax=Boothiomyces macroporosus TaxID=261099 RepID=A0AAD5Y5N5_9FUNG|nr:hypothetical protein HK103_000799 [Boothiomyces macroporosus]